ncbi:MAG: hypothetical protein WDN28_28720 [Chthoniobacter sp.]
MTVLWWAFGYSLVFDDSFKSPYLGGSGKFFFKGVLSTPNHQLLLLGLRERLRLLSVDVRHHHPGAHRRRPSPSA